MLIPIAMQFNIDLIFFGVMTTLNMMVGILTPTNGNGSLCCCSCRKYVSFHGNQRRITVLDSRFRHISINHDFPTNHHICAKSIDTIIKKVRLKTLNFFNRTFIVFVSYICCILQYKGCNNCTLSTPIQCRLMNRKL